MSKFIKNIERDYKKENLRENSGNICMVFMITAKGKPCI